jgi:hypothetical protein
MLARCEFMHSEKMAAEIPVKCDEINNMEESWLSE